MIYDTVIVGGGPAGLSAALGAKRKGAKNILILERSEKLGGILNQCIHNGFGLHTFKTELTGPEYAYRYIDMVEKENIPYILGATVLSIAPHSVTYISEEGLRTVSTLSIVLAMGCRERPRGALNIPGTRPSGVFSAGTAQNLVNLKGRKLGKRVVILGSGDIGLIMARRMTLEGAKVLAVVELMPYSSGLKRNIVQCLDDFSIPLLLSHTVTKIEGKERVEGIVVSKVDEDKKPIKGSEIHFDADTLLLSVGLLPENELSRKAGIPLSPITGGPVVDDTFSTEVEGIFAAGNVLHVHDLVDYVSEEAEKAGEEAALYALGKVKGRAKVPVETKGAIRYSVPSKVNERIEDDLTLRFRVSEVMRDRVVKVEINGKEAYRGRRRIMAPGEMETVRIKGEKLKEMGRIETIRVMEEKLDD